MLNTDGGIKSGEGGTNNTTGAGKAGGGKPFSNFFKAAPYAKKKGIRGEKRPQMS